METVIITFLYIVALQLQGDGFFKLLKYFYQSFPILRTFFLRLENNDALEFIFDFFLSFFLHNCRHMACLWKNVGTTFQGISFFQLWEKEVLTSIANSCTQDLRVWHTLLVLTTLSSLTKTIKTHSNLTQIKFLLNRPLTYIYLYSKKKAFSFV